MTLADGTRLLIDTSPDLRDQALRDRLTRVAPCCSRADTPTTSSVSTRCGGSTQPDSRIPCFGDPQTIDEIRRTFWLVFDPKTPAGGGLPEIDLHVVDAPFEIGGCRIVPVPLWHGKRLLYGYRIGSLAYLTDVSRIPSKHFLLHRRRRRARARRAAPPSASHALSLSEALEATARIKPADAWFTHICHDLGHSATNASLPPQVRLRHMMSMLDDFSGVDSQSEPSQSTTPRPIEDIVLPTTVSSPALAAEHPCARPVRRPACRGIRLRDVERQCAAWRPRAPPRPW